MPPPIYSSLSIPAVGARPSPRCVQWTEDGQLIVATKTSIYVLTPEHGINLDLSSLIRSNKHDKKDPHVGWFRTMVQIDKTLSTKWPEHSQDWSTASLGSIDTSIQSVAVSPSGITSTLRCVLAVLTSNMDLTLFSAGKNRLKGEWSLTHRVTPFIIKTLHEGNDDPSVADVLKTQIVSVSWTPQADFSVSPRPNLNASLLVGGTRGGTLEYHRYNEAHTMEFIKSVAVADAWINRVACSDWKSVTPEACRARLAFGIANVGVSYIEVTATIAPSDRPVHFGPIMKPVFEFSEEVVEVINDGQGITTLHWLHVKDGSEVLAFCRPGYVFLWTDSSTLGWTGVKRLRLAHKRVSSGSSPFLPVSGFHYIDAFDALTVGLFDGSVHTIHQVSVDPTWSPSASQGQPSLQTNLTASVRSVFVQCESSPSKPVSDLDDNRMCGYFPYDTLGTMAWLHTVSRTSDFSYMHEAKLVSTLAVAKLWDQDLQDAVSLLERSFLNARPCLYVATASVLRPIFFYFRSKQRVAEAYASIVKILSNLPEDHSKEITLIHHDGELSPEVRHAFRYSLIQHLFGWNDIVRMRVGLSLSDFLWVSGCLEPTLQAEFGLVAQSFLHGISHRVLRTVIRHLAAVMNCLTEVDVPFVSRAVLQTLLPGVPPDLAEEGASLSVQIRERIPVEASLIERCPACKEEIQLQNITAAVCSKGHTWSRCSITTFILSTPYVRTCVGCTRKAFLPPSAPGAPESLEWLPAGARGWVVVELLEAVHRCLFCNNTFVSVV
ncbi:hypothetical protein CYLTODRAFT_464179 [Cylindrobasidium torrendii FP15055 ss-10]|uniref:Transcription factor IIIC putative zinc-finger domain-containing protein n=1 Tax=Cylindrobasidium torrendii FP15055 ss-10 TaxID=1314674 RepID=A0A0D7B7J7_9AGAR|nr:hypothetical protein CYLTODRAFT_464179 [Cylindrobasidium torrendii FP15055 ss-10]